ncbi:hypothetical protein COS83_00325 [archaeon CG07_land_8_20_14_0_80_38_8]|nr:MAG: hypothetical protein COS83_00325 [archaeon CG07_land_8_20_14_0_80_38_8]PIU89155.1 MAG: hypothetical protein COS64_01020 [archaeon CG06_land_8_20_14_3_00_37_11]
MNREDKKDLKKALSLAIKNEKNIEKVKKETGLKVPDITIKGKWIEEGILTKQRLKILAFINKNKKISVLELAAKSGISQSEVSQNLAALSKLKIIRSDKDGRKRIYCLNKPIPA